MTISFVVAIAGAAFALGARDRAIDAALTAHAAQIEENTSNIERIEDNQIISCQNTRDILGYMGRPKGPVCRKKYEEK